MPTVSVIIPTFNRVSLVSRAIESVLNQTRPAEEVIVIDDGSTDSTVTTVRRKFPQVKLLKQPNNGVSTARNLGIRSSRGEWIALLDSDDIWHRKKLHRQLEELEEKPEYFICHTDEYWIRNGVRVNPMKKHRKHGGSIFQYCLPRCAMSPSSILIHRDVFKHAGMFDETLPACEDYDLWLRICARYPVLFVNEKLVTKYGGHSDQLSGKFPAMDRFRILSLARLLEQSILDVEDRAATVAIMLDKIRIYLNGAEKHGNTRHVAAFRELQASYTKPFFPEYRL